MGLRTWTPLVFKVRCLGSHFSTPDLQSGMPSAWCFKLKLQVFWFPPICGIHPKGGVYSETMFQPFLSTPMWFSYSLLNVDPKKCINILHFEGLKKDSFLKNKMAVFIRGELEMPRLTYWVEGLSQWRQLLHWGCHEYWNEKRHQVRDASAS